MDQLGNINFVSVYLNFVAPVAEEITQSSDQVKMRSISKLINGISRVFQKLLKCFNGNAFSTSFVLPTAGAFYVILILYLNDSDCVILSFRSSL